MLATMVIGLALLCAAPVMALDVDFSGEFRLRGVNHDNIALSDPKSASQAWYDTRARIKTTFKVNDNISFITRFDALDNRKFGSQNTSTTLPNYQDYDEFEFDIAYAIVKTPYGAFLGGRMIGSQWGPSPQGDSNLKGKDRILWYVPIDKLSFGAYAEKQFEQDSNGYNTTADGDNDKYTALIQHKGENLQLGLLASLYDYRSFPTMRDLYRFKKTYNDYITAQSAAQTTGLTLAGARAQTYAALVGSGFTTAAAASVTENALQGGVGGLDGGGSMDTTAALLAPSVHSYYTADVSAQGTLATSASAANAGFPNVEAKAYILDPYVSGNFGPFSYFAEAIYAFGDADYVDPNATNILVNNQNIDVDALMYHLEGKYKFGPAAVRAGYWYMSGDDNTDDNKMQAIGYIENNRDMDILMILTGNPEELGTFNTLGGLGNFSADTTNLVNGQGTLATAGAKIIYAGIGWQAMDNLHLDFAFGNAKADKPPGINYYNWNTGTNFTTEWSEEVGNEYDFTLKWTPMENLEYKIRGGYLDAGDFWKQGSATAKIDNMYTLFHALTITF